MFGNCCGRKKTDKHKKITRDAETQSDNEVLGVLECPLEIETPILKYLDNKLDNELDKLDAAIILSEQLLDKSIIAFGQPKITSDEKRQSVISAIKIEISSEADDDEVFCEGVGPPVKLADNLGTPENNSCGVPLPKWFSLEGEDEDELETDGTQEPPVTPVGKDELALRRHRFFSELLTASQNANNNGHKVHFDPLGPVTCAGADYRHPSQDLELLVTRLEDVTHRLENLHIHVKPIANTNFTCVEITEANPAINMSSSEILHQAINAPLEKFLAMSAKIGTEVAAQGLLVEQAFKALSNFLDIASKVKKPTDTEMGSMLEPVGRAIVDIQELRERSRGCAFFNHLSAVSESIPALGWVTVANTPAPFVKEMNDSGEFYTNRVLKEFKGKDQTHVTWAQTWVETLLALHKFVKQYHTTGVAWNTKGVAYSSYADKPSGPAPPACPPPPPFVMPEGAPDGSGNDRSALFAQINQGQDITKSLKKMSLDDAHTAKSPALRTGPAPFKCASQSSPAKTAAAPVDKPPTFVRDGKKWLIEYQKGNKQLNVDNADMNNVVYLYKCEDSTLTVRGKINSITLDSCKKTAVIFDRLVSGVEFINCQSVQMQVLGMVPTISIDKTDGCQIYLSADSLDVEIVSSKSSEMNVLVPALNGDFTEYPVPEQYKTTVVPGKGLNTVIVESKG